MDTLGPTILSHLGDSPLSEVEIPMLHTEVHIWRYWKVPLLEVSLYIIDIHTLYTCTCIWSVHTLTCTNNYTCNSLLNDYQYNMYIAQCHLCNTSHHDNDNDLCNYDNTIIRLGVSYVLTDLQYCRTVRSTVLGFLSE